MPLMEEKAHASQNTPLPPPTESQLKSEEMTFSATTAFTELCATYDVFLDSTAGKKAIPAIYINRDALNLPEIISIANDLKQMPLSVEMLQVLFSFVEKYTGIPPQENLSSAFKKNLELAENVLQYTNQLECDLPTQLHIVLLRNSLSKKNAKQAKQFELSILEKTNKTEIQTYLANMWTRLANDDVCITKEYAAVAEREPNHDKELLTSSLKDRFVIGKTPRQSIALTIHLLDDNESICLFSADAKGQPTKVIKKGQITIPVSAGDVVRINTATKTELFYISENGQELLPLGIPSGDTDLDAVLHIVFDALWQWHVREFEQVDAKLFRTFAETLCKLPLRKNTGALKSTLRELLHSIEPLGFPSDARVEILDRVDGLNGRGMVLDQNVMALLEKKGNLTFEQWNYLLDHGRNKATLLQFFENDTLNETQNGNIQQSLSEVEKKYIRTCIESAIPAHNIANMVRLFTNCFPLVPHLEKKIAKICYRFAAQTNSAAVPFEKFKQAVRETILDTNDYTETDIETILKTQDMTVRWLHAKSTRNFSELATENLRKITALSMTETVKVSEIPTPRLRYDLEQKALIIKASLAETLPHELHQYLQLRSLQGSFSREYCLNIENLPNHTYLESLLLVEMDKQDIKRKFIPADKITKALFRFHLGSESTKSDTEKVKITLELAAKQLAQNIIDNPENDIIAFIKKNIVRSQIFKKYETEGKTQTIFTDPTQLQELCITLFSDHVHENTEEGKRFQRLLTTLLWKMSTKINESKRKQETLKPSDATAAALFSLFSQAEITVEGFHGWGANDETLVPFIRPLSNELKRPTLLVANNYMGASGSNMFTVPNLTKQLSFRGRKQDMDDYGRDHVELLSELDGIPHGENIVAGHSMGGLVVLRTALDHGEEWGKTTYLALEPVISTADKEIPNPNETEKTTAHYISLLGAGSADTRPLAKKIAAIITKWVTSPEDLPDIVQNALVYLGRIKVNTTVYNQLVEGSNPRVALSHYMELITNRLDFHTHVTPILQENEALLAEEKSYLATKLANNVKIVISKNDDVLKHEFALWELLQDPAVSSEHRKILAKILLIISGNHYGHLETKVHLNADNPEHLPNTSIVAKEASKLISHNS